MKIKRLKSNLLIATLIIPFLGYQGCKEDDFPVPTPSSQAKFSYEVNIVDVGEQKVFEVTFTNLSINATSYLWNFGNGNTSTQENPVETYQDQGDYAVTLTITSENDLHYNKLVNTKSIRLLLKETILFEGFDGEGPDTPDEWLPEGWLAIDADGDGLNWYWADRSGNGQIRSQSWDGDEGPLTPDNWLITPEINLTDIEDGIEIWLNFNVCPTASTPIYKTEHYGIFVSTATSNIADFTDKVWEETLLESMDSWIYQFREVDLTEYIGQKIYIAIRHYESTDKDRIVFDDVEVFKKF